jgi:HAD superfamily hydrolase (TIGR01509 family)
MIHAVIFDFDGTLIQTEKLKAEAYALAAVQLKSGQFSKEEVVAAFKDFVGGSREEVSKGLLERFGLEEAAQLRMSEFSASAPWQVLTRLRLQLYNQMLSDVSTIREAGWEHNLALLQQMRAANCQIGLATMSHCQQVGRLLQALELSSAFDFIATRDDVDKPKPDPEIYLLVARALNVPLKDTLIIEDSVAGVQAGLSAGAHVLAVVTPMTREKLHQSGLLDQAMIVDSPEELQGKLAQIFSQNQ